MVRLPITVSRVSENCVAVRATIFDLPLSRLNTLLLTLRFVSLSAKPQLKPEVCASVELHLVVPSSTVPVLSFLNVIELSVRQGGTKAGNSSDKDPFASIAPLRSLSTPASWYVQVEAVTKSVFVWAEGCGLELFEQLIKNNKAKGPAAKEKFFIIGGFVMVYF